MKQIYLDYNASAPLAPEVVEAMRLASDEGYGNPSSLHWAGAPASAIVKRSRQQVASLLGCSPEEVVFTSGGSEANNLALKGTFYSKVERPAHIITRRSSTPPSSHHAASSNAWAHASRTYPSTVPALRIRMT